MPLAAASLSVLDLRTTGLLKRGVSTAAARAKQRREGQQLSVVLYRMAPEMGCSILRGS